MEQAAADLGLSVHTIRAWIARRRISHVRLAGRYAFRWARSNVSLSAEPFRRLQIEPVALCRIGDPTMGVFQRSGRKVWWFEFEYRGRRYRESAGTRSKTLAIDIERNRRRQVEESANGIRRHRDAAVLFGTAARDWLSVKEPSWASKTQTIEKTNIAHLKPHFGRLLLTDITDVHVAQYQAHRRKEKAANKTINNEVGTLRAILRRYRLWAHLAPDVRMLAVREDAGRALTVGEEEALLKACAASRSRSLLPAVTLR